MQSLSSPCGAVHLTFNSNDQAVWPDGCRAAARPPAAACPVTIGGGGGAAALVAAAAAFEAAEVETVHVLRLPAWPERGVGVIFSLHELFTTHCSSFKSNFSLFWDS